MPFLPNHWHGLAGLGAVALVLPWLAPNDFALSILVLVGLNATVCVGLNLLVGAAGQISLGHAAFIGIGAYASALLTERYGVPPAAAIGLGCAACGLLAALVGWPLLRLRGHYLAMATLGVGVIIHLVLTQEVAVTGGPDGRPVAPLTLFGHAVQGQRAWYWLVAVLLLSVVWIAQNLLESRSGRALKAVHASEPAARALGVDVAATKLRMFVLSAMLASLCGSLYAHYAGFITPDEASFLRSVELVVMVVVGGLGSVTGSIVGAALLTALPQLLTQFHDYEHLVFGLVLMAVVVFLRKGLVPALADLLPGGRRV